MSLLLRNHASRRYAIGSGLVFVLSAVVIGALSVLSPRSAASQAIGLALAALLLGRGLLRLRQARVADRDLAAQDARPDNRHPGAVIEPRPEPSPDSLRDESRSG
jgi:hypothetical protein